VNEGAIIGMAGRRSLGIEPENVAEGFGAYGDDIGGALVEGSVAMTRLAVETNGRLVAVSSVAVAVMLAMPGVEST
jgi:hypothetical protein